MNKIIWKGIDNMKTRLEALYKELDTLLNMAPVEEDCTDEENRMYSDMANLKESMFDAGFGQKKEVKDLIDLPDDTFFYVENGCWQGYVTTENMPELKYLTKF